MNRGLTVLLILLTLYVGSYFVLSRLGMAEARRYNMRGFHYFPPEDSASWRALHFGCMFFYHPINLTDQWLGGPAPGSEPMWGLSK